MFMQMLTAAMQVQKTDSNRENTKKSSRWIQKLKGNESTASIKQSWEDEKTPARLRPLQTYSHLWLRRLPLYMVVTWGEIAGANAAEAQPNSPTSLSLCPNVDRLLVHFQLQPHSPAASDHTISQTIPGGTFPSNTASCTEEPPPPHATLSSASAKSRRWEMTGQFHCDLFVEHS